jgi:hypothetical protein
MIWTATPHLPKHISLMDALGLIPTFLDEHDPRAARDQIGAAYGWSPIQGQTLDKETLALSFPGDPDLMPWVTARLRDEHIVVYPYGLTMIRQPESGAFEVSRLD